MKNFATPKATELFSTNHSDIKFNLLGASNLKISSVGFGSYRVHISVEHHREALKHALLSGINLIDTSSNYADGGSEELIGSTIKELSGNNKIMREELVIVSKVGYLQGQNFELSQEGKFGGSPFKDLVEYSKGLEHCIHPNFIAEQLSNSLSRLGLQTIDAYLLHNPEYYLLWAHKQGISLADAQKEYYRRIEKAFMHLEIEAQNGRIQYYGISSNTLPIAANRYDFTSLEKIIEIAESISKDHKFRVIQFPMNLFESEAVTEKTHTDRNLLDFARKKNVAVLVNRPLNAFVKNKMKRLVSLGVEEEFSLQKLEKCLDEICRMEEQFLSDILPDLKAKEDKQKELTGFFSTGTYLAKNWQKLGSYWQWLDGQASFLAEQMSYAIQLTNELENKSAITVKWLDDYVEVFNNVLGNLTHFMGAEVAKENDKLKNDLNENIDTLKNSSSLQHMAISSLTNSDGVDCVLSGMRKIEYVEDILSILKSTSQERTSIEN